MKDHKLKERANWVRQETLKIHKNAPETRIASALSCVEILTVLYYGGLINYTLRDLKSQARDRFIISKAHGVISLYPILADLGFFNNKELINVCREGAMLGGIPDMVVPGFETINGSLGHGIGVSCGVALALNKKRRKETVFTLVGDGELNEGSMWEAVMFAGEHQLDNLVVIVDNNKGSMLDFCKNILDLEPLVDKFNVFKWQAERVDGHDVNKLYDAIKRLKGQRSGKPKVLIAETVKGRGVPLLECDPLSHIRVLKGDEVDRLIGKLE